MTAPADSFVVLDSVAAFEKLHRAGEGTYGVVYCARHRATGQMVALKKVRFDRARDGVPLTSIREVQVLQECRHPNIVSLKQVVTGSKADSMFLVFEWADHDLGHMLDVMPRPFSLPEVKCLMLQLLQAVSYLHRRWVIHRDIKMSNLLYCTATGTLKLCDFGLARYFKPEAAAMTPKVVTLWYRAPELLLGAEAYTEAVDMWAVGCVLAELLQHKPLFAAHNEVEALRMQCDLLGAPSARTWPAITTLPLYGMLRLSGPAGSQLRHALAPAVEHSEAALDLLAGLLAWDPSARLTAAEALAHPFFSEKPHPSLMEHMPRFPGLVAKGGKPSAGAGNPHGEAGVPGKRLQGQAAENHERKRQLLKQHEADQDRRFAKAFG